MDIVAVGNANLDLIATVDKLPGLDEKVVIQKLQEFPGGSASNYAVSVSRLGMKSGFIGRVGNDEQGRYLINALKKEGVDVTQLKQIDDIRTGFAMVITTIEGDHVVVGFRGANAYLHPKLLDVDFISRSKILHFSSIRKEMLLSTADVAEKAGVKLSLDPGRDALTLGLEKIEPILRECDYLFVNQIEFKTLTKKSPSIKNISYLSKLVRGFLSVQKGAEGVVVANAGKTIAVPAFKVEVLDTTGAGDSYTSSFTVSTMRGYDMREAATYGCATAAIKCTKFGARTGLPNHQEVLSFLKQHKRTV